MSGFRRGRSKVWWANYSDDRDDHEDEVGSCRFSRRRSLDADSNRNSSSSPSNGSQKSQDSGFSDSESSSPSSCSSKGVKSETSSTLTCHDDECHDEITGPVEKPAARSPETSALSKLPETPVNRIPRPYLIRHKRREAKIAPKTDPADSDELTSKCNSISSYLAECYFPITNFVGVDENFKSVTCANELPHSNTCPSSPDQRHLSTVASSDFTTVGSTPSSLTSNSRNDQYRTCFIVDELPKKNSSSKNSSPSDTANNSRLHDTSLETSSSSCDMFRTDDDTVRYVEKNECLQPEEDRNDEMKTVQQSCIPVQFVVAEPNESRSSMLDLSHLPEPNYTSTPKKDDTKIHRRNHRKLKRPSPVVTQDTSSRLVDPPVARWLLELQYHYEPECMTTLQAKRVMQYCKQKTTVPMVSESTSSVQTFQNKTKVIANQFMKLYEKINIRSSEYVESHLGTLINCIKEFIISYSQLLPRMESSEKENLLKLMDMCDRMRQSVHPFDPLSFMNDVNILEKFFSRFVDSVLTQQIMLLTVVLEHPNSESSLLNALYGISSLNLSSSRMYELVTKFDSIRNLLNICVQSQSSTVRKAALRVLATVCQNAASIRQLEKAQGIEMLSDMLSDVTREETELFEIVSVLVQITAPWIEDDHIIKGLIYHLHPILNALSCLITTTNSCETLLLCSAALANISFIEPQAVFILVQLNTADRLLTAVRKLGTRASVFLQEQAATLIANMAAEPEARAHLAQHRAVGALLCFLQVNHSPIQTAAEIAAAERLQHKSAIALSRLCTNPEISKQIIELQGVSRLVRLCREERERNYSDGVLVACLASLRKITANCGIDAISRLNAKELVEPRLVDSFLLYSSRQESYV